MGQVLVSIEDLVVRFRLRRGVAAALSKAPAFLKAVNEVSFDIHQGEILGLVGESGSGKTTIGKALLRLYEPEEGKIVYRGNDITHMPESSLKPFRRDLQMIFQDPLSSLNPRHTVRDALATPFLIHGLCDPGEVDARVDDTLNQVGLSPVFRMRFPHELSGGQLQRVAIGRALTMSPALIVADEAVSKLDVSIRAQILNLFKDLQASLDITILFITHDLHVARYLCGRIGVMYFGQLLELAPTDELFASPRHPYTEALLGTLTEELTETATPAMIADEAFNPTTDEGEGCRYYERCPIRRDPCRERRPPMKSVGEEHAVACFERDGTA